MSNAVSSILLAISYDMLPELREHRARYYQFWNAVGVAVILGWVLVLVLYRIRTPRKPIVAALVAVAALLGSGLGWAIWTGLEAQSWRDYGVGDRWIGELAACVLGWMGWLLVGGWLLLGRR